MLMLFFIMCFFVSSQSHAQSDVSVCHDKSCNLDEKVVNLNQDVVPISKQADENEKQEDHIKVSRKIKNAYKDMIGSKNEEIKKLGKEIKELENKTGSNKQRTALIAKKKQEIQNHQKFIENAKVKEEAAIAQAVGDKDCQGLFKTAEFRTTAMKIVGVYVDEPSAQNALDVMTQNPGIVKCDYKKIAFSQTISPPPATTTTIADAAIGKSGAAFSDNSKQLSTQGHAALDDGLGLLKQKLGKTTDPLGRTIETQIKEIKIYTCASTYRNCDPANKASWTQECQELDQLRHSQQGLSPRGEQALWSKLSAMRAENVKKEVLEKMKTQGIKMEENVKITVITTGHPDDPLNNKNILPGSCGPLPVNDGFWKNECDTATKNSCTQSDTICDKMKQKYKKPEIIEEVKRQKMAAQVPLNETGSESYKPFRYFRVEPVIEEKITEIPPSQTKQERWQLSCNMLKFNCSKKEIKIPPIKWPGWSKGKGHHKGGKPDECPRFGNEGWWSDVYQ